MNIKKKWRRLFLLIIPQRTAIWELAEDQGEEAVAKRYPLSKLVTQFERHAIAWNLVPSGLGSFATWGIGG
jgi:hypothetical protein